MKTILLIVIFTVVVLSFTGAAQAVPYLDVLTSNQYMKAGDLYTFNFNLNSDVLSAGDIGPEDILNSAKLRIKFTDNDKDKKTGKYEYAAIIADGDWIEDYLEVDSGRWKANILSKVYSDHILEVKIIDLRGDFYLDEARLSGKYTDRPAATSPVPEPATLSLLGLGIVGLLGFRKKK